MPRKNNDNNPLQVRLRVNSLPKRVSPEMFHKRLIEVIHGKRDLPPLWDVEIGWRNPGTKHGLTKKWRYTDFETAVSDSRDGFNMLLHDALGRRLRRIQER